MRSSVALGLVFALLIVAACTPSTQSQQATPTATSASGAEAAYDFTLQTLDGQSVTLSSLSGRWVLLNFWATWCVPCVKEMPYLSNVANERDMAVFGVNFNETAEQAAAFVAQHAIPFPILMDPDDITLLMYEVRGLPRTFVIAPDGTIAGRFVGEINPKQFEAWLDSHQVPRR